VFREIKVSWNNFKLLKQFINPYRWALIIGIILSLIDILCKIGELFLSKNLIDFAIKSQTKPFITSFYFMVITIAFHIIIVFIKNNITVTCNINIMKNLRNYIAGHIARLPVWYIEKFHTGDLTSRVTSDLESIRVYVENTINFIFLPLFFCMGFTYMFLLSWKLLLLSLILTPGSLYASSLLNKPLKGYARTIQEKYGVVNSIILDTVGGIYVIKAYNLLKDSANKFANAVAEALKWELKLQKIIRLNDPINIFLVSLPQFLGAFVGGYMVYNHEITAGTFFIYSSLVAQLVGTVAAINGLVRGVHQANGAISRISEVLDQPIENITNVSIPKPNSLPIVFKEVYFGYDTTPYILNPLSFTLSQGKMTALVGPSGSGKSTIFKLLTGFYYAKAGSIQIFGIEVEGKNISSIRKCISLVSQDTYLFPGTIYQNIVFGKIDATEEEVIVAAKAAYAHDFISKLPKGYQTKVKEKGVRLSFGEKQRIAIARAILKNAPILLLDEPTAALDTQSELIVKDALRNLIKDQTIFVIAHRLSTIKEATEVLVLDNGRIIEQGTHEQLMQRSGLYKQLYLTQFS
jgi:ABC-type multidrug transport system fused ATPase/permease subunit